MPPCQRGRGTQPCAQQPRPHFCDASRRAPVPAAAALQSLRASLTKLPRDWYDGDDPCGSPACGPDLNTPCAWTGLACNASRVVAVWLPCLRDYCFAVGGTLAPGLANATALEYIELAGNSIGVPQPAAAFFLCSSCVYLLLLLLHAPAWLPALAAAVAVRGPWLTTLQTADSSRSPAPMTCRRHAAP